MDGEKREYGLGKARIWTVYRESVDWVKGEYDWVKGYCGLGRAGVWIG